MSKKVETKDNNNKINSQINSIPSNLLSITVSSVSNKMRQRISENFYEINITNNLSSKKWKVDKTIIDFENLGESIQKLYPDIPQIPKKTIFNLTDSKALDQIKLLLQNFLRYCISKIEIILNQEFVKFWKLTKILLKF